MSEELLGDVVELLQRKRDYHKQQLGKIEQMLSIAADAPSPALPPERTPERAPEMVRLAPKPGIPWTSHIRKVFANGDIVLSLQQLRETLAANGVADAKTIADNANTIIGIVGRLVGHGELVRNPDKTIKRGPKHQQSIGERLLSDLSS